METLRNTTHSTKPLSIKDIMGTLGNCLMNFSFRMGLLKKLRKVSRIYCRQPHQSWSTRSVWGPWSCTLHISHLCGWEKPRHKGNRIPQVSESYLLEFQRPTFGHFDCQLYHEVWRPSCDLTPKPPLFSNTFLQQWRNWKASLIGTSLVCNEHFAYFLWTVAV